LRESIVRTGLVGQYWPWQHPADGPWRALAWPRRIGRWLGLGRVDDAPSLAAGACVAILSSLVVVGLWPILREVGLQFAIASKEPELFTWERAASSIIECATSRRYWWRLWQWEAWSLSRWWLLFGGIAAAWMVIGELAGWRRVSHREEASRSPRNASGWPTLARLLAFAPWLVLLEMTFLVGVWISSPNTVPEPSTGFVVGIFSWDLWHWDCWLNREWLIRGAIPSLVVGYVFFRQVTAWPRSAAAIGAMALIPVAIAWSVACTVAWQCGLPWLG